MEKLKQELFILVRPETTTLFEGEQLNITYTLFSRLDIDAISLKQSPDFPGFYKEDIFNATRLEYKKEVLNDRLYNTALLKKLAVFPIKAGDYSPKPIVLEATAIVKSDDLFSFFGKPYTFNLVSNDVSISVKPLPENTTGKVFSYIVGDLTVTVTKRENTVNTGESTTCYVILKSTGNINTITDPTVELSSRGRVYLSDTITDKIEENENVYLIKKFEYTIIPEESGVLSINTKDFLYYDISSQSYTVASAEPVQINITGKDIFQEKPIIGSGKEFSGGGFNYIKGNVKSLKSVPKGPFGNPFYYLYHVILAAAVGILLIVKMKKETLEKNENLFKKKKARFTAGKILEDARKTMESRNYPKTVDLIYQALATYIAYKSEKKPQEITIKNIGSILNKSFTDEDSLRVDVFGIIEQCTMLKFSREGINNKKNVEMLFQRVTAAIDKMESYIPTEYRKIKTRIQT
jgi:hypothetical protein